MFVSPSRNQHSDSSLVLSQSSFTEQRRVVKNKKICKTTNKIYSRKNNNDYAKVQDMISAFNKHYLHFVQQKEKFRFKRTKEASKNKGTHVFSYSPRRDTAHIMENEGKLEISLCIKKLRQSLWVPQSLVLILKIISQPRYVVNQVTAGDYVCPRKVLNFLTELHAAFRMLNLRNDLLRRKFNGMKYNLRKGEEVYYDVKMRGLTANGDPIAVKGDQGFQG
ncbi:hypothetical protein C5167_043703 [Papaver somniferum]|uniref:Uncharacterized protein n=1 Tax=Papaver somniferum TaxID=3469 RepID=A0A4Y7L6H1_PAPSO|nr:hypothetical protein C5167_043703 [Papaver somniferum]